MERKRDYSLQIKVVDVGDNKVEYVAQYIQFPTIIGVGDTAEEALAEAKIFLEEYLEYCEENNVVIKNNELESWKANFSGKITIRIPKSLHRDLYQFAEEDGMSINYIVNDSIRAYLSGKALEQTTSEAIKSIRDYATMIKQEYWENPKCSFNWKNQYLLQEGDYVYGR